MSPRTAQQFKEIREDKMSLIMEAALKHFAGEGYFRSTINQIAKQAGISNGLIYNYFDSKEALLKAILHKSVNEIYQYLDINRDGILEDDEFEFFIRKINTLLSGKRDFWRLLIQLLAQNDVREQFLNAFPETDSLIHLCHQPDDHLHLTRMIGMLADYFKRKKARMGDDYDPEAEFSMFVMTLTGFMITCVFSEEMDNGKNEDAIRRIIQLYK